MSWAISIRPSGVHAIAVGFASEYTTESLNPAGPVSAADTGPGSAASMDSNRPTTAPKTRLRFINSPRCLVVNVGLQKATLAHGTATFVFESACKLLPRLPQGAPGVQWLGYLLVVHLGGSRVLFHTVSMDARLGVEFLRRVNPRIAVPVHYDDYGVFCSPLSDFEAKVAEAGLQESVTVIPRGVTFDLDGR